MPSEAMFTAARPDCPHPERWFAYDNQSTEEEVMMLAAGFVRALQPDVVLETGTHKGLMAEALGLALQYNGQGHLVTIEADEDLADQAAARCHDLPVTVIHGKSLSVSPADIADLAPGHVGFAWFDSLVNLRLAEFDHFSELFDSRTIVAFHDAGPHHGGWSDAVRAHPGLKSFDLPTPRGCILAQVVG